MPSALKSAFSIALFCFLFFLPSSVLAESQEVTPETYKAPQNANYTVQNLQHTALCELAGRSPIGPCLGTEGKTLKVVLYNGEESGGALGALTGVLTAMYMPPTSTTEYLADIGQNLGVVPSAYAADPVESVPGSGAGIIEPVRTLWQAVRNVAYLAFILIFLVIGFMVMFKQKINPQTVVTAQAALPGLVIGLLLVTFSYFIAALMIDLAFVGIPLAANVISQASPNNAFGSAQDMQNAAKTSSIFQLFGTTATKIPVGDIGSGVIDTIPTFKENIATTSVITGIIGAIVGAIVGMGLPGAVIGLAGGAAAPLLAVGVISLIIPLILIIALFVQMFRLLLALIGTYITLLFATITGPFAILMASVPGRGGGIGEWLKTLVANALVFPAVFAAFLFMGLILGTDQSVWAATPPLFGGITTSLLRILLAFGIVLATPAIPDAVRGAFGIKPQQGGLVGAALGGFMAGAGTFTNAATKGGKATLAPTLRTRQAYQEGLARWKSGTANQPLLQEDGMGWLQKKIIKWRNPNTGGGGH